MGQRVARYPEDGAEFSRVLEAEDTSVRKDKIEMIVLSRRGSRGEKLEETGHSEVDDKTAAVTIKEKVFPPPSQRPNSSVRQDRLQFLRHRQPKLGRPYL